MKNPYWVITLLPTLCVGFLNERSGSGRSGLERLNVFPQGALQGCALFPMVPTGVRHDGAG